MIYAVCPCNTRRYGIACALALALLLAAPWRVLAQDSDEESVTVPGGVPSIFTRHVVFDDARKWASTMANVDKKAFSQVEDVDVYWYADRGLMEFIASFPRLQSLYIHELPSSVEFEHVLAPIAKMKRLEYLDICMVNFKQRGCAFLGGLTSLKSFKCDVVISESDVNLLARLRHLRTIDLPLGIAASGRQRRVSKEMERGFQELTTLAVCEAAELHYFRNARRLEDLWLLKSIGKDDIRLLRRFGNLKRLEVSVRSIDCVAPLCELPSLDVLKVGLHELASRKAARPKEQKITPNAKEGDRSNGADGG